MADNTKLLQLKVLDDPRWIERIRLLDKQCFPVKYSDRYYDALLSPNGRKLHDLSYTAFFNGVLVGSITCRLEPLENNPGEVTIGVPITTEGAWLSGEKYRVYIMTIGVLEAYRGMGIASKMLNSMVEAASKDHAIDHIALHNQVGSSALDFYQKVGKFEVVKECPDYYTDVEPKEALLLQRNIVHSESKDSWLKKEKKADDEKKRKIAAAEREKERKEEEEKKQEAKNKK